MDKGTAAVPPHVALISGSLAGLGKHLRNN